MIQLFAFGIRLTIKLLTIWNLSIVSAKFTPTYMWVYYHYTQVCITVVFTCLTIC